MLLQLTNVGQAPIVVKDQEGYTDFVMTVAPATTEEKDVTRDLVQRLASQLTALETPILDVEDNILVALRWAVVTSDVVDDRAMNEGLAGLPSLNELQLAGYSTGTPAATVVATGTGLLGNQVKATLAIQDAAAAMTLGLEAVLPGGTGNDISVEVITPASTLLVSVVANKITIRPATGGSTIAAIVAAIDAEADALLLVQADETVAGTLNEAVAEQWLSGGTGPGVSLALGGTALAISALSDTSITFATPSGISTDTYHIPLEFRNGPHVTRLSVPVVT
jgi:hypothetical protein